VVLTVHPHLLHIMSSERSHGVVHTEGLRYLKNSTPGVPNTCVTLFHWSMSMFIVKDVTSLRYISGVYDKYSIRVKKY